MLKTMRETVPKSDFMGKAPGKDSYYMMLDQKIAEGVAVKGDGLGIQKILYKQLSTEINKQRVGGQKLDGVPLEQYNTLK